MLTLDEARSAATTWRERFSDPEAFATSWSRYMDHYKFNRSPESLAAWLRADAEQDEVRAVGLLHEPLLPVPQDLPALVDDCPACRGKRWLRREFQPGQEGFGVALRCPSCDGRPTNLARNEPESERNQCWNCRQFENETAAENCKNPRWHWPNWTMVSRPVDGDYVAELARQMKAS